MVKPLEAGRLYFLQPRLDLGNNYSVIFEVIKKTRKARVKYIWIDVEVIALFSKRIMSYNLLFQASINATIE